MDYYYKYEYMDIKEPMHSALNKNWDWVPDPRRIEWMTTLTAQL